MLDETEKTDETEELVKDMISIVTVFSARLYGRRSRKVKQKVKEILLNEGDDNRENKTYNKTTD